MKSSFIQKFITLFAAIIALANVVNAQTFTTLHNFYTDTNDGLYPVGGLTLNNGTLYGTATQGGPYDRGINGGTIFSLGTNGSDYTTLHAFSLNSNTNGFGNGIETNADGSHPSSSLILSGNTLYGTCVYTGPGGYGTIFSIGTGGANFSVPFAFPASALSIPYTNVDGAEPLSGVAISGTNLYGTTPIGGSGANGTIFKVSISGAFTLLHTFAAGTYSSNSDGAYAESTLILSGSKLYGTTYQGNPNGYGTIFSINTDGSGFTTLHAFNKQDGANPVGNLLLSGNTLFGSTAAGGANNSGAIFAINTDGGGYTLLHSFSPYVQDTNSDGDAPKSGLFLNNGILYGTAEYGGVYGYGTVFSIATNGSSFTIEHAFNYTDGANPLGGIVVSNDVLYGTASMGGSTGGGTIYSIAIHPAFFAGEASLGNNVYYLQFPNNNLFGYYTYAFFPYLYHYDLGFEYFIDANDGVGGAYLYDFTSSHFWYTSPIYPFPFLYDFSLNAVLYYYPNTTNSGHYTTNPRYFHNFGTGHDITM